MTTSIDTKLNIDGGITMPINLGEVDKSQFVFYLAGKVPLTVTDLAADCISDADGVKSKLQNRFANDVNMGMADTLSLSGAARKTVISGSKPYIKAGQRVLKKGQSYQEQEELQSAADCYRKSVTLFQVVKSRFQTVDHESSKVDEIIENTKRRHDEAAREAAKDTINYQTLLATQYESEGDDCRDTDPPIAVAKYKDAIKESVEARTAAESYNESKLLSDSVLLSLDPIESKIESLSEKVRDLDESEVEEQIQSKSAETQSTESEADELKQTGDVDKPGTTVKGDESNAESTTLSTGSDARASMLDTVRALYQRLGRIPKTTELPEECEYSPNDFYKEFGSWDETLEAAGIDKEQALLEEIRLVAEELGRVPNTADMDEHGTYSGAYYGSYFGSWSTAIDKSEVEKKYEDKNASEKERKNYVDDIKKYAEETDEVLKATEFSDQSDYSLNEFLQSFESWYDALEEAGVDNSSRLLDEMRRVGEIVGHRPSTAEMNEHGSVSAGMYSDYFGTYTAAIEEAFGNETRYSASSDTQNPSPDYELIEDINQEARLDDKIAVKICEKADKPGDKKDARLRVKDIEGTSTWLSIWSKHNIDVSWNQDDWYVVTEVRGKYWENNFSETRELSSTKDLQVVRVGTEPPTGRGDEGTVPTSAQSDISQSNKRSITSDQSGTQTDNGVNVNADSSNTDKGAVEQSPQSATASDSEKTEATNQSHDPEQADDDIEEDSILDDIVSDFVDIDEE
jgi:hypothetical protein